MGMGGFGGAALSKPKLKVAEVGSFEASFVPTIADIDRLDASDSAYQQVLGKSFRSTAIMDLPSSNSRRMKRRSIPLRSNFLAPTRLVCSFPPFTCMTEQSIQKHNLITRSTRNLRRGNSTLRNRRNPPECWSTSIGAKDSLTQIAISLSE